MAVGTGTGAGWCRRPDFTSITATAQEWPPSWPWLKSMWCQWGPGRIGGHGSLVPSQKAEVSVVPALQEEGAA